MNSALVIRPETDADVGAIRDVTVAAFGTLAVGAHTGQFVIDALRAAGVLTVSPVAELHDRVVGHIAFSFVMLSDGTPGWYGLGPVGVLPEYQRQAIGKALIEAALARLEELGARGCCLVGHPGYYRRFGFDNAPGLVLAGLPPEVFFALSFDGRVPRGSVGSDESFKVDGPGANAGEA